MSGSPRRVTTALLLILALPAGPLTGQEDPPAPPEPARRGVVGDAAAALTRADRPRLLVTGIAGSTIYLSLEDPAAARGGDAAGPEARAVPAQEHGPGAVLELAGSDDGPVLGSLRVIERAGRRLLTRFEDEPFPVTRGDMLYLVADGLPIATSPPARPLDAAPAPDVGREPSAAGGERLRGPRLSGLLSLESDLRRSRSRFVGRRDGTIERTFVTPGARVRATLSDLPGGVRLHASLRAYHRERDSRRPLDETRAQVFEAYAEAAPRGTPLTLRAGRFLNRDEAFGAWWDGASLRLGSRRARISLAAGWEPGLDGERIERDLFKAGATLSFEARSRRVRWAGSLSAVRLDPREHGLRRTTLGASQRLAAGPVRLHANGEVERDTASETWRIARLRAGASLRAGPITLRTNASRLRRPLGFAFDPALDPRRAGPRVGEARDRLGGGLSIRIGRVVVGGDATWSRDRAERESRTWVAHLLVPGLLPSGLGLRASGFRWEGAAGRTALSGSAIFSRRFGHVRAEGGYRLDRSESAGMAVVSHGLQVGITVVGSSGWTYRMDGFVRRGADLETERVYGRLARAF